MYCGIVMVFSPKSTAIFKNKSPKIIQTLCNTLKINVNSAAAILGNLGHESAGFTLMQEVNPVNGGRGGHGWAQWTGPRRRAFEAYCAAHNLEEYFDEANLGFLIEELKTTHRSAIKDIDKCTDLMAAVQFFEQRFERADPRFKHYDRRLSWAELALSAYEKEFNPPTPVLKPEMHEGF